MRLNRSKKFLTLMILLIAVTCLTIGFAAFSSTLSIKSRIVVNPDTVFRVKLSSSSEKLEEDDIPPSVKNPEELKTLDATISNEGIPTISNMGVTFTNNNQYVTYEFYTVNVSDVDAYLTDIIYNNYNEEDSFKQCLPTSGGDPLDAEAACDGISVRIQIDDINVTDTASVNNKIEKDERKKVTVTISYDENSYVPDEPFTVYFGKIMFIYSAIEPSSDISPELINNSEFISTESGVLTTYLGNGGVVNIPSTLPVSKLVSDEFNFEKCLANTRNPETGEDDETLTNEQKEAFCTNFQKVVNEDTEGMSDTDIAGYRILLYINHPLYYDMVYEIVDETQYPVDTIEAMTFTYRPITDLTIPSTVNKIGNRSFVGAGLTNLTIPNSVTQIDEMAFSGNNLTSITIPASVTTLGNEVFSNNKITSINYVDASNLTTIGNGIFDDNNLTSVDLSYYKTVPEYMFMDNQITSVVVPSNVEVIGDRAFYNNPITNIDFSDALSLTTIDESAFYKNSIQSLDFLGATSLSIIGSRAFSKSSIQTVDFTGATSLTTIGVGAFMSNYLTSVVIPDSVTTIDAQAFRYNNLTSVEIGSGITSMGSFNFYGGTETDSETNITYGPNELTSVRIKTQKDASLYQARFGWANGYSDNNIVWNSNN